MFLTHTLTDEECVQANTRYLQREHSAHKLQEALQHLFTLEPGRERDLAFNNLKAIFELWENTIHISLES